MCKIAIVGGGAAGMLVAVMLAERGYKPVIFEKNDKLGKKLFITGKGRCNLTNNCDVDTLLSNVVSNPKFLYSSFYGFDSEKTINYFDRLGLKIKTERGGRVFPASDHSSDVIGVLLTKLKRLSVEVHLNTAVIELITEENETGGCVTGIVADGVEGRKKLFFSHVIVATGGLSYPLTGSTGDGIRWAHDIGLAVKEPVPSLVPMNIKEKLCGSLMGLTLRNVVAAFSASVKGKTKMVYSGMGELLFTHFGISGPIVLTASSYIDKYMEYSPEVSIDLKPALTGEQLNDRILRDFDENINRQFRNSLNGLLPKRLIPYIIEASGIDGYKRVNTISRKERQELVNTIKDFRLHIDSLRGFDEAIITKGGVMVKELNPHTMETKRYKGLFYIGEAIDVDALTGGYNLQIAWSTAASCAQSFAER